MTTRHLNPGGFIEVLDSRNPITCDDGTLPEDSATLKWTVLSLEASRKLGSPMDCALHHKERLLNAGFINVVQTDYKWPMSPWPEDAKMKELGKC